RRARHHAPDGGTRPDDRLVSRRQGASRAALMSDRGNVRIALKVDVDTHDGLARGVPAIAELLARCGVPASFFVACGPDRMGRRIARLLDPRFGAKLLRTRALAVYGWRTLLSGTLLPSRPVATAFPDALRRLAALPTSPTTTSDCCDRRR